MSTPEQPRIAIVGAGPGGLVCARVLQRHGIQVTVHDLDAGPDARPQGGTLDLHADSGQVALAAAGLRAEFLALSRPEGQQMRLLDQTGAVLFDAAPGGGEEDQNPEIDRGQLRTLLLDSLRPGTVRWGQRLTSVRPLADGSHRLLFDGGDAVDADLVIGADGAWSRVRGSLSPATPGYTGVTFVEVGLDQVDGRHPEVAALVGSGTMMALHADHGLIGQRNSNGHLRVYIAFRDAQDWHARAGLDLTDADAVRAELLGRFAGWSPDLLRMITEADSGFTDRPLFALPVPHEWRHVPGITLIGDAAHLMSPFSGMGANLALLDGAELALALVTHPDPDAAVQAYEKVMLPRSAQIAQGAADGLDSAIAADAPFGALEHFRAHGEPE